jgi:glycosyltransferase involved in cell wall biosynthesis
VRLIRHSANCGVAAARNTLLAGANGALIAFFDDDDESAPQRLERRYRRILEYESTQPEATVLCYSNRNVVRTGSVVRRISLLASVGETPRHGVHGR